MSKTAKARLICPLFSQTNVDLSTLYQNAQINYVSVSILSILILVCIIILLETGPGSAIPMPCLTHIFYSDSI